MLNGTVLSWRKSRRHSGGDYTSISRTPTQSQANGIRKHWRTFSLRARGILRIYAECHIDANCCTTTKMDVPCTRAGGTLPPRTSSLNALAPPPYAASKSNSAQKSHPVNINTSKEVELAWFEKTARRLRLHSRPGIPRRWWQGKRGASSGQCGGGGQQSYDEDLHHHMARLHLVTSTSTTTTEDCIQATPSTSGDSADAPEDRKLLLMGANPQEEEADGAQTAEEGGPGNEKDARRAAWEVLKKHVLYVEEHGDSPLDIGGGCDAERALRELRARLRLGWAEETMRMQAPEESVKSTKKRRRDAGCWIRENGVLLQCAVTHTRALESSLL